MVLTSKAHFYQKVRPGAPASYDQAAGLKVLQMARQPIVLLRPPLSFRDPHACSTTVFGDKLRAGFLERGYDCFARLRAPANVAVRSLKPLNRGN
jgi:hypothetical protein